MYTRRRDALNLYLLYYFTEWSPAQLKLVQIVEAVRIGRYILAVVNSSLVLFYLGKKVWEGHTTDVGSQGFHAQLNFLERTFKKARCVGI